MIVDPPPTTEPPPELPATGLSLWLFFLIGVGLVDAGVLLLLRGARRLRNEEQQR